MSIVTDDLSGIDGPTLQDADVPARTVVLSAHGGSGATTVASHLGLPEVGAGDAYAALVLAVVTVRTTTSGFDLLLARLSAMPAPVRVVVAASADVPTRAPAGVRARSQLLRRTGRDVAMVVLPYEAAWRYTPFAMQRPSKAYRRQLSKLSAVINHYQGTRT